jgi:hypothetical protein
MKTSHKKLFMGVILGGFLVFLLLFSVTMLTIYKSVTTTCTSVPKHPKEWNCAEHMLIQLNSTETTFREKNRAVWVLGQLGDPRALPALRSYYTGIPDHKEPLDKVLSQYELRKAIKWCERGNATNWMYRKFL